MSCPFNTAGQPLASHPGLNMRLPVPQVPTWCIVHILTGLSLVRCAVSMLPLRGREIPLRDVLYYHAADDASSDLKCRRRNPRASGRVVRLAQVAE